jgi:hypothetical protein
MAVSGREISKRWPHIGRFVRVDGWVEDDFVAFHLVEHMWTAAERAAAYDEWADFYQWRLAVRVEESAGDRHQCHFEEQLADNMVYLSRRCAAYARGEDPGPWQYSWERRPDLAAARHSAGNSHCGS